MKTRTIITEIHPEDLQRLLSLAVQDSKWLALRSTPEQREGIYIDPLATPLETWVKILYYHAGSITAYDTQAEGELRGCLDDKHLDGEDGVYMLTLEAIGLGLEDAANSTYAGAKEVEDPGAAAFSAFYFGEGFTKDHADVLLQIILFNEIVY